MPAAAARASSRSLPPAPRAACGWPSRSTRCAPTPARCSATRWSPTRPGPAGKQVNRLYIEDGADIARELYLSMLVDRATGRVAFVVSTEGGMDIEDGRARHAGEDRHLLGRPGDRRSCRITAARVAKALGLDGRRSPSRRAALPTSSTGAFVEKDMSLLEINPLIVTKDGQLRVPRRQGRASTTTRSTAIPTSWRCATRPRRTPRRSRPRNTTSPTSRSTARSAAWSTAPGSPWRRWTSSSSTAPSRPTSSTSAAAPRKEKVTAAFKIITADPNVKGILVNIFGGIMRCDVIAEGVIAAVKEVGLKVPLVVRLEGTNVELGKKIIDESGLNVISADDLDDAAQKIVAAVKGQAELMSILIDAEHQGHLPGLHRQERHLPLRAGDRLRHQDGRRRPPGKGGSHASRPAGLRHGRRGEGRRRAPTPASIYVPPAGRGGRDLRGDRRRDPARSSASPRAFRCSTWCKVKRALCGLEVAPDRPELPGRDDGRTSARSASCRATSSRRARSASCRAPAR